MYLVVGLGNPGKDYTNTRHNVGFNSLDILAKKNNIKMNKLKFKSVYGEGFIGSNQVILVKPQTYMNNSGIAVREILNFYKLPIDNLIVIVDDVDIEFADIRIRQKGSAGSHNGLKSIIYHIRDDNFPRVKIGIGKKHPEQDLADFVLSRFSKEEERDIADSILNAAQAVESMIRDGIEEAMNKFNTKSNKAQE
ncbi:MAG TPA: aminoacyl-tRNA hydrolase [Tissierellaceae bacterium]|nr:aminoacyl-tRNA hydrolase [Tissierellaceae bacterium]